MGKCVFANGTLVEDYGKPYFVAEVNSSHQGKIDIAKEMINAAVKAGCDCVKFQSWTVGSLYSKTFYQQNPVARRFVKKYSMSTERLEEIAAYCCCKNIAFSSTPYSEAEVDFLAKCDFVPYIKIASMELNNPDFLTYIGQTHKPLVLSTGMGEVEEIKKAVRILEEAGATQIVILHCVSNYPTKAEEVNLNNILLLREMFPQYPIGFSDHTLGDEVAIAAIALGAAMIEKHITLDRTIMGMDNNMATEPTELVAMVQKCRLVQMALGNKERRLSADEYEQRKKMRRSIVAVNDIPAGKVIERADLCAKRPGYGIAPDKIDLILGKKTKHNIEADTLILSEDVI